MPPEADLESALTLLRKGQWRDAITVARNATGAYPTDGRAWRVRCEIALHGGALVEAVECGQKAVDLDPADVRGLIQLGRCLAQSGERGRALELADRAAALHPEDAALLDGLGAIYSLAGEPASALKHFRGAVMQGASSAHLIANLAACERMVGELDASEQSCNRALALDPRACQAYYIRADLKHWTTANNHIAAMEAVLGSKELPWREERYLRFALAKEHEDLERYPAAFAHFQAGNSLQRTHMKYDVSRDVAVIDRIIATHTSSQLSKAPRGYESGEPIFVTGLPRTGTSLVERILGAHSAVYPAGELNDFALALLQTARHGGVNLKVSKSELVERSLSLNMRALGQQYIERTRPRTGRSPCFVDKLPGNYLYLGLISAALPRARLILLERDAMDACCAIFNTLFAGPYPFSYDLSDLGTYYLAYRRLADHWVQCLGDRILVVKYENLVREFEHEAHRLIEFCGLPWEDACATYYRSAAASTTASAVQVRQPVYRTSIGRWRVYEQQLAPLRSALQSAGISVT